MIARRRHPVALQVIPERQVVLHVFAREKDCPAGIWPIGSWLRINLEAR